MITAKEARSKALQDVMEHNEFKILVKRINNEIEYSVKSMHLKVNVFVDQLISSEIKEALKTYYTDLGYSFDCHIHFATDSCHISIGW